MTQSAILNRITRFYLESTNFNGMPASSLAYELASSLTTLTPQLSTLVEKEAVSVLFGDNHPNPFIRALPDDPVEQQIHKISSSGLEGAYLYPLPRYLNRVVNRKYFEDRPFSLQIALGEPQYSFQYFDPALLDYYLEHTRCNFTHDVQSTLVLPDTKIRFTRASVGPSYGVQFTNLLSANLQQLGALQPVEQQLWDSMALPGPCTIHPEVVRTLIHGQFSERISVFEALIEEMHATNALCNVLKLPSVFVVHEEPQRIIKNFGFLPTPSIESFHKFFLNLQILLLQNVNPAFLKAIEKPTFRSIQARKTRKLERPSKTALEHVNAWLKEAFSRPEEDALIRFARLIKQTRHELYEQMYYRSKKFADHTLLQLQRRLMWYAYHSIKAIRICFEQHLGYEYPQLHPLVREDKVWVF